MVPALILALAVVALSQFAVYYWRAVMAGVAAQPLSDRVREAAALAGTSLDSADFEAVVRLHQLAPGLKEAKAGLGAVRTYYSVVKALRGLAGLALPSMVAWADREMTTCTQYVAVLMDQRLTRNLACATEIRSY